MTRTLLRSGVVHTPAHPHATALAVEGGTVVWVGDERGADGLAGDAHEVVRLGGALVAPSFVDSHVHLAATGLSVSGLRLHGLRRRAEALERVGAAARARPAILLGFGWDETLWDDPRPLTRQEVDRVCDGLPVYLSRVDVHSGVVSTRLLELVPGIQGAEGWSPDGRVERDAHHLARAASNALVSPAMREEAIATALRRAAAEGIGMVHELGAPHLSLLDDFAAIDRVCEREPAPEVARYWGELGAYDLARELGLLGLAGDLCVDGSIGSHTTAVREPYADRDTTGHAYLSVQQLRDHVAGCTRQGLQAGFHVIGDRANDMVREALQLAAGDVGADALRAARHRMEHVEMPDARALAVMADLGVHASVQPAFDAEWGGADGLYAQRLGAERALAMNPFRTMRDSGVGLALGSDSPVTALAPWHGVRAAVHHRTPGQQLTTLEAFAAHTAGGRAATGRPGGRLAVGAPADFAVWEVAGDLDADRLPRLDQGGTLPRCLRTTVQGRTIYTAGAM